MTSKLWCKVEIHTGYQCIEIYPNIDMDGIIIETKNLFDEDDDPVIGLDEREMEVFIQKMREMMVYVKAK